MYSEEGNTVCVYFLLCYAHQIAVYIPKFMNTNFDIILFFTCWQVQLGTISTFCWYI